MRITPTEQRSVAAQFAKLYGVRFRGPRAFIKFMESRPTLAEFSRDDLEKVVQTLWVEHEIGVDLPTQDEVDVIRVKNLVAAIPGVQIARTPTPTEPDVVVRLNDREVLIRCDSEVGYDIRPGDDGPTSEPEFRIADSDGAARSIRLLVSEGQEADLLAERFLSVLESVPEHDDVSADPLELTIHDQIAVNRQPPRIDA